MTTSTSPSSALTIFKRGIKRDVSVFPILKDEKHFSSFSRSLFINAKAQDCDEVLNHNYKPANDNDSQALFSQKQYYMYSVFNHCLLTDMGKTIVRKFQDTMDAQSVWKEYANHMLFSTNCTICTNL